MFAGLPSLSHEQQQ
ncbi:YoaH family protein, partial [Escherichia coli]